VVGLPPASRGKLDKAVLINFAVDYFRSFGVEQTLNMVATTLRDHPGHCVEISGTEKSILQVGVIYGPNASGKSNLVKAMLFAQQMILGRTSLKGLAQSRFRFVREAKPASFEFRFLSSEQVFVYGFTATQDAVVEEWLDAMSESGREINVFTRRKQDIDIGRLRSFGENGVAPRRALRALKELGVRNDQLLLNKIVELPDQRRGDLLSRAVWWFAQCLTIVPADSQYAPLMDMIDADVDFRRFCGAFLRHVGTGIDDLSIEKARIDADKVPKALLDRLQSPEGSNVALLIGGPGVALELDADDPTKIVRKHLSARHQVNSQVYSISFQEESDGTQRCLNLLPALYHVTRRNQVFVVDEIDRSLHPLLCHALLKLFLDACPGRHQQMIVTTHETHLLDLDLLRRDEVWFIEKDRQQQSHLSSLGDLNARKDLRIEKGYLQGRFGGIPFIGDTKKLIDMIQCPVNGTRNEKKTPT
jgi:AAA15 family ATPase/GTPase